MDSSEILSIRADGSILYTIVNLRLQTPVGNFRMLHGNGDGRSVKVISNVSMFSNPKDLKSLRLSFC